VNLGLGVDSRAGEAGDLRTAHHHSKKYTAAYIVEPRFKYNNRHGPDTVTWFLQGAVKVWRNKKPGCGVSLYVADCSIPINMWLHLDHQNTNINRTLDTLRQAGNNYAAFDKTRLL